MPYLKRVSIDGEDVDIDGMSDALLLEQLCMAKAAMAAIALDTPRFSVDIERLRYDSVREVARAKLRSIQREVDKRKLEI